MTNTTPRAVQDFFCLPLDVHPTDFIVVAGDLECVDGEIFECPDLISGPLTWSKALEAIKGCDTYHFSRIELGDQALGRASAILLSQ